MVHVKGSLWSVANGNAFRSQSFWCGTIGLSVRGRARVLPTAAPKKYNPARDGRLHAQCQQHRFDGGPFVVSEFEAPITSTVVPSTCNGRRQAANYLNLVPLRG